MNFLFTGQLYTSGTYKLLKCTNAIVKHFALVFLSIIHFNQICPSNQYAKRWVHNKRNSTVSHSLSSLYRAAWTSKWTVFLHTTPKQSPDNAPKTVPSQFASLPADRHSLWAVCFMPDTYSI